MSTISGIWRFRNFCFYPGLAPTGLVRAEDSLETETRFKEKEDSRKTVRKKEKIGERKKEQEANWRRLKKFREKIGEKIGESDLK